MLEFIFELIAELFLQLFADWLTDRGYTRIRRNRPSPAGSATASEVAVYAVLGGVLGGLSLLIFKNHLISSEFARLWALFLTPFAVGCAMMGAAALRAKVGEEPRYQAKFACGVVFSLAFGAVRYGFAQ
jgi:hypothetical protein